MCKHDWDWRTHGPCSMCADQNSARIRDNLSRFLSTGLEHAICDAHNQLGTLWEIIAAQQQALRQCAEIMRRSDLEEFQPGTEPVSATEWFDAIEQAERMCGLTPNSEAFIPQTPTRADAVSSTGWLWSGG